MREIKFRAKERSGEWHIGSLFVEDGMGISYIVSGVNTHEDYPAFDLEPAMGGDFNSLSYCMIGIDTKITVIGNIHDNPELLRLTKK